MLHKATGRVPGKRRRLVASITAIAAAVGLAGIVTVINPLANADQARDCTPIKLIVVPGTWETTPEADPNVSVGMLQGITQALESRFAGQISSYWVPYEASAFDQSYTYADSKHTGVVNAEAAMEQIAADCPGTKFVPIGYSQGAAVAGDITAKIGQGRSNIPADRLIATGLLSDPGRGTEGEEQLGDPIASTTGMAGPREGGFSQMSGKVGTVCLDGDLYCATPQDQALTVAIGRIFSQVSASGLQESAEQELAGDLGTVNGQQADLTTVPTGVDELSTQAQNGDLSGAGITASNLKALVAPLQGLLRLVGNDAVINGLLLTPPGSPTNIAGQVLQVLVKIDFVKLTGALDTAVQAAYSQDADALMSAAVQAVEAIAPATGIEKDQLAKATRILQTLKPSLVISQAENLINGFTSIDYQGIINELASLPVEVVTLNLPAIFESLLAIEDRLLPLAETVNKIDFKTIGAFLAMWPEGSPERMVGDALVILDRVDWVKLLADLRTLTENLSGFDITQLPAIDLTNPEKSLQNIFGVNVLEFVNTLAGMGDHLLSVAGIQLPNGTLQDLVATALKPEQLISEGITVATFYASQVHTAYGTAPVDGSGRAATVVLADWLTEKIAARA